MADEVDAALRGQSAELVKFVKSMVPYFETRDAHVRRLTAEQVIERLTVVMGQLFEGVLAEFTAPTKSAGMFDEPLSENDPIENLRLTKNVTFLLKTAHFETIGQMRDAGDWDLRVRGIGEGTLAKIDVHLAAAGHPRLYRGQDHGKKADPESEETPDTA